MTFLTEEIEYLIDNNLFFEKIEVHTCNLHVVQYIKYFEMKNKISLDRKSTRLNSSHSDRSRMPSSA